MVIKEHRVLEIKGAGNTLISLSEDNTTDEFIRSILYFLGNSLEHIAKELEEDNEEEGNQNESDRV